MRSWLTILLFALICAVPALAQDIDAVKIDPAHHQVVFENEQVRVVRWIIPPHDKTLNHTHPDGLNIDLTDYNGKATTPQSTFEVHEKAGTVRWRSALTHVVENLTDQPMEGILVEPKRPASARPAGSADPIAVDAAHQKVLFENDQIRAIRERRASGRIPMHGHPDNVQVLLADARLTLTTPDGRTQEVSGKARDVRWRTASQHAGEVPGDQPLDQILIEMKGVLGAVAGK